MTKSLAPGDVAPDFTLPDADGTSVSLASYRGRRVIVYFYPAALTPGCTTQACDLSAAREELLSSGLEVLGISPDAPAKLAKFRDKENLTVTLLGDPSLEVLKAYGAYGVKKLYGKEVTGVLRSTIVVDAEGKVELAKYNVKAKGHVDMLRKALGLPAAA